MIGDRLGNSCDRHIVEFPPNYLNYGGFFDIYRCLKIWLIFILLIHVIQSAIELS
jgi:hypothetical protein